MAYSDARALPAQFLLHLGHVEAFEGCLPSAAEIAAATPAPWPLTAQHIMLRTAACETLSPPMQRPATISPATPFGTSER